MLTPGKSSESSTLDGSKPKDHIPRWIPITLLAVTTGALALPIYLLRRQRASMLSQSLQKSAPPPRRSNIQAKMVLSTALRPAGTDANSASTQGRSRPEVTMEAFDDGFNAPLQGLKAFGIATTSVVIFAATGIWAVKAYTGVQNTEEFAIYMRQTLLTKMPLLMSRIYRRPTPSSTDHPSPSMPLPSAPQTPEDIQWTWNDAEQRLKTAFEQHGFAGWAEAVTREVEEEARLERIKRGLDSQDGNGSEAGSL